MKARFGSADALLIVDMQHDFLPGGALAVSQAGGVVERVNHEIAEAAGVGIPIIASRDWHPPNHASFAAQGGPWPEHCVRHTPGAAFCRGLQLPPEVEIVDKGTDPAREQYSPFEGNDLASRLRARGVARLWIAGVALEYCVRAAVLDALQAGFEARLLTAGTAPVDPAASPAVLAELEQAGARLE